MKHISFLLFLLFPVSLMAQDHGLISLQNEEQYVAGIVNLKVKAMYRDVCTPNSIAIAELTRQMEELESIGLKKKFVTALPPATEFNENGLKLADISLIYTLSVPESTDIIAAAKQLAELDAIEYAEPQYVSQPLFTPNDANLNSIMPYHFDLVNAYEAWDITLGDTNVVIGITDTSFDVDHQDLSGNIKYNYDDPIGGGDDDLDLFIDNYAGWDVVDNDNTLFINNEIHGTAVAAISSASANNGIGYAGIGFKCKFIPVKVANNSQSITHGYEGIEYCVNQGCSIVNCSWGNTTYSQVAQDVITWAAINHNVVVVASAGNTNTTAFYYPASYNYALSVTGVNINDILDDGVNSPYTHNDSVDVSAPGRNVYTTATFNGSPLYSPPQGGTSMAAPIVSGIAGLVRSVFPCMNALEVIEKIKDSADPIDGITQNVPYAGMIGTGRVNAELAVTGTPCDPVGISESSSSVSLDVYPNPSLDQVNVRMGSVSDWDIRVMDTQGKIVQVRNVRGDRVIISGLAAGFYSLSVSNAETSASRSFAIIEQ